MAYIEREALLKDAHDYVPIPFIPNIEHLIERQPAAEVEPVVHARWIYHVDDLFPAEGTQECSHCHEEELLTLRNENRCPNCGAKMDLKEDNHGATD